MSRGNRVRAWRQLGVLQLARHASRTGRRPSSGLRPPSPQWEKVGIVPSPSGRRCPGVPGRMRVPLADAKPIPTAFCVDVWGQTRRVGSKLVLGFLTDPVPSRKTKNQGRPREAQGRVGKGCPAGSIELRVSPSPSKIPYGGFSPVRLQMDRQWRPSTTSQGLSAVHIHPLIPSYTPPQFVLPEVRDPRRDLPVLEPRGSIWHDFQQRQHVHPEALGSPAGYVVPSGHRLLRPHPPL